MPTAGDTTRALDFPAYGHGAAAAFWNATITSYGKTTSSGTQPSPGFAFVAPISGAVKVTISCRLNNTSSGNGTRLSAEVREGDTVGSGTVVSSAADQRSVLNAGGDSICSSRSYPVTGLTVGNSYNIDALWAVSAGTGGYDDLDIFVEPLP